MWAVVVGINDYPKLPKVKYAVNDAQAFFYLLSIGNQVPAANITLLVNDQATLRNLRSALGIRLKEAADKDDMVIIYFAGRNGAVEPDTKSLDADGLEKYLLAYDSDPSELYATGFPMREIAHILDRIRSERLIFVADSCYSGASGGRTVSTGGIRANIADTFLERIAGGRGKVVITASAANEVSVEKDDLARRVHLLPARRFEGSGRLGPRRDDHGGRSLPIRVRESTSRHRPGAASGEKGLG